MDYVILPEDGFGDALTWVAQVICSKCIHVIKKGEFKQWLSDKRVIISTVIDDDNADTNVVITGGVDLYTCMGFTIKCKLARVYGTRTKNSIKGPAGSEYLALEVWEEGKQYWYDEDELLHRDNDLPAEVWHDESIFWWQHGLRHRDSLDKPSYMNLKGFMRWYQNGELHRPDNKPAVLNNDGSQEYHENGLLHRDNDNPAIIFANETYHYYKNGERYFPPSASPDNATLPEVTIVTNDST